MEVADMPAFAKETQISNQNFAIFALCSGILSLVKASGPASAIVGSITMTAVNNVLSITFGDIVEKYSPTWSLLNSGKLVSAAESAIIMAKLNKRG